jgi:hypothetical protein
MGQEEKDKFEVGKWYKDSTGDFVKFTNFNFDKYSGHEIVFSANVRRGIFQVDNDSWLIKYFDKCIPMTIKYMKYYLPESEWWEEKISELFPIY